MRLSWKRAGWASAAVAIAGCAAALVGTAQATPAHHAQQQAGHTPRLNHVVSHALAPGIRNPLQWKAPGSNWGGYAASGRTFHSVSATWVQPSINCSATPFNASAAFWVGLDGFGTPTVEQTGTEADCQFGVASYSAWYEMYPAPSMGFTDTVRPGDVMTASVTYQGSGRYVLTISDRTRNWSHTINQTSNAGKSVTAEVVSEAPWGVFGPMGLPNFGSMKFTNATIDGSPLAASHPQSITLASIWGTTRAAISPIASDGGSFTVAWKHS